MLATVTIIYKNRPYNFGYHEIDFDWRRSSQKNFSDIETVMVEIVTHENRD